MTDMNTEAHDENANSVLVFLQNLNASLTSVDQNMQQIEQSVKDLALDDERIKALRHLAHYLSKMDGQALLQSVQTANKALW